MTTRSGIDVVSVVYETELPLQELQLRSLGVHAPPDVVGRILVIDNCARPMPAALAERMRAAAGPLGDRVEILRPDEIARVPRSSGWRSQQVLKLAVAHLIGDGPYVVLDAKNHLVGPLTADYLLTEDGRGRVPHYGYESHPLRSSLERVLRYVGVDPAPWVASFPATVTPFVFDGAVVQELLADVERTAGRPFPEEFVARELTEFFLYSGWIISRGRDLSEVMELTAQDAVVVWPKDATAAGVAGGIARSTSGPSPFFSVHRRALARVSPEVGTLLAAFWAERGLFDSEVAATTFIHDFAGHYEQSEAAQRRRELPAKAAVALRRVLGRGRR